LIGRPPYILPSTWQITLKEDFIQFNFIKVDVDVYIIQCVTTGDYLNCGTGRFRDRKLGTEFLPNFIRWRLKPFRALEDNRNYDAYALQCLETGNYYDAGPVHMRKDDDLSRDQFNLSWNIINIDTA
jgi:hypothetical protein